MGLNFQTKMVTSLQSLGNDLLLWSDLSSKVRNPFASLLTPQTNKLKVFLQGILTDGKDQYR